MGDLLYEDDFYRREHRLVYAAQASIISASKPADVITVYEYLQSLGSAEEIGGLQYLNALAQSVPSAANIRRYAEIVRERSILRKLIAAGDEIATRAFNPEGASPADILSAAASKLFAIGEEGARGKTGPRSIDELVVVILDQVQDAYDKGGVEVTGTATGFPDLDKKTGGLQGGDLVILAARPSMGKTGLAMNIADHVAVDEQLPVVVFSMEQGAVALARRTIASRGKIRSTNLRTGNMSDYEWGALTDAVEQLRNATLDIDETPALTLHEVQARARRAKRKYGKLGLIVIDYLQLMGGSGDSDENRASALGAISRGLKALARELECPIIALSQLNRGVEARTDKRPMMSDLRESGALEQDADVIMFVYRDDYYNKNSQEPGVTEVIIGKQRDGPTGTVKLLFQKDMTRFVSYTPEAAPAAPPAPKRGREL